MPSAKKKKKRGTSSSSKTKYFAKADGKGDKRCLSFPAAKNHNHHPERAQIRSQEHCKAIAYQLHGKQKEMGVGKINKNKNKNKERSDV
jgi:hypothetical protein